MSPQSPRRLRVFGNNQSWLLVRCGQMQKHNNIINTLNPLLMMLVQQPYTKCNSFFTILNRIELQNKVTLGPLDFRLLAGIFDLRL